MNSFFSLAVSLVVSLAIIVSSFLDVEITNISYIAVIRNKNVYIYIII